MWPVIPALLGNIRFFLFLHSHYYHLTSSPHFSVRLMKRPLSWVSYFSSSFIPVYSAQHSQIKFKQIKSTMSLQFLIAVNASPLTCWMFIFTDMVLSISVPHTIYLIFSQENPPKPLNFYRIIFTNPVQTSHMVLPQPGMYLIFFPSVYSNSLFKLPLLQVFSTYCRNLNFQASH